MKINLLGEKFNQSCFILQISTESYNNTREKSNLIQSSGKSYSTCKKETIVSIIIIGQNYFLMIIFLWFTSRDIFVVF